jgi:hypothetical protein
MASGEGLLRKVRESQSGHSQEDFCRLLEYYGYELQRHAKHGAIYRHADLASHADPEVRREHANIMVPKGDALRPYVARKVLAPLDILFGLKKGKEDE